MPKNKILNDILAAKRDESALLYKQDGLEALKQAALGSLLPVRSFTKAISGKKLSLIAEVKKASPSKGVIRTFFDPVSIAVEFEKSGASALSVLTDDMYFQGALTYIADIKSVVQLPVLRKDFLIDPIQVYESRLRGADAILLIKAILEPQLLQEMGEIAVELGMDVLVEVHDSQELETVLKMDFPFIIGINNRNLKTFKVDTNTAIRVKTNAKKGSDRLWVCESGIKEVEDLDVVKQNGFSAVLIGEGLAVNPKLINWFG